MSRRTLDSVPGFATEIGFYLGGMEEVREQLREAVEGMSDDPHRTSGNPRRPCDRRARPAYWRSGVVLDAMRGLRTKGD